MVGDTVPNTIITGGAGTIGSSFPFGIKLSKNDLDVSDAQAVTQVIGALKPNLIIHTAALTDVDYCESHPGEAYAVNTLGTYYVALAARRLKAILVVISTGAVFPGKGSYTIDSVPNPINVYGRTKYLAELVARDVNPQTLIVRTGWIFGNSGSRPKFIEHLLHKIRTGESCLSIIRGQVGCPTWCRDFNQGLVALVLKPKPGIYHLINGGVASRFQIARTVVKIQGVKCQVKAVPASQFPASAPRPQHEVLVPTKPYLRPWQEALQAYLTKKL